MGLQSAILVAWALDLIDIESDDAETIGNISNIFVNCLHEHGVETD